MHSDVLDLRDFYGTSLGQVAQRMIRRRLRLIWPSVKGECVLGLGYATPFLRPFVDEAERVLAVMPAQQGVVRWPRDGRALVTLADEAELPLPDMSVDRVLLVHAVESTDNLAALMREVWRVLNGSGRLLAVVPNRRGLWSRSDRTPFGHGHPYSGAQLSRMLRQHQFVPDRVVRALYVPPFTRRFLLTTAPAWEDIGPRWFERFSGVVMVEATKQIYQRSMTPARRVRRPILVPVARPVPAVGARAPDDLPR